MLTADDTRQVMAVVVWSVTQQRMMWENQKYFKYSAESQVFGSRTLYFIFFSQYVLTFLIPPEAKKSFSAK